MARSKRNPESTILWLVAGAAGAYALYTMFLKKPEAAAEAQAPAAAPAGAASLQDTTATDLTSLAPAVGTAPAAPAGAAGPSAPGETSGGSTHPPKDAPKPPPKGAKPFRPSPLSRPSRLASTGRNDGDMVGSKDSSSGSPRIPHRGANVRGL